ncbi:DUF5071 domain-containing protein [Paenibacillus tuaregi]|uniref:DUF5071 domain-containing protein n=1 Tax=Paenibacillus tuaregi TaxID=1816681 RepID=UPI003709BA13
MENILLRFDEELIPHIHKVLQTNDGQWKYFLLEGLVNRLPNSNLIQQKMKNLKNWETQQLIY